MQIRVKSLQGDEYIVNVQNNQLVSHLKASISEKANGLPIERQKLVYKGRTMQDICPVADYNLEEDCKVHMILQKENPSNTLSSNSSQMDSTNQPDDNARANEQKKTRFEIILRERLAEHFSAEAVEKIMANLHHEINADINSASLDDLEQLAKQKLNISNE